MSFQKKKRCKPRPLAFLTGENSEARGTSRMASDAALLNTSKMNVSSLIAFGDDGTMTSPVSGTTCFTCYNVMVGARKKKNTDCSHPREADARFVQSISSTMRGKRCDISFKHTFFRATWSGSPPEAAILFKNPTEKVCMHMLPEPYFSKPLGMVSEAWRAVNSEYSTTTDFPSREANTPIFSSADALTTALLPT